LRWAASVAALLACSALPSHAYSQQSGLSVVGVQEDWELYLGEPDPNSNAPQVACTFSPAGHLNDVYAVFEVNFQSQPEFVGGGLQLQIWNGDSPTESRKFPSSNVMSTNDEVVQWTQTMELHGGVLSFEILNGSSTTWGGFGGQGFLKHSTTTSLEDLSGYSPDLSVANSGAAYAGNRVRLLVLRKVRYLLSDGQVVEDNAVRVAHPVE
jgi:hypothetical protein